MQALEGCLLGAYEFDFRSVPSSITEASGYSAKATWKELAMDLVNSFAALHAQSALAIEPRHACVPRNVMPVVYVVDDDISVRESLELLIRTAGWRPELFECAQKFLSCEKVTAPSCLVLEVNLPGLNGLDLQKQVAADRSDMPIIFITGFGDVPTTVEAMKAGAVEFFEKPLNDDLLVNAIQQALERSRSILDQEAALQSLRSRYNVLSRREREVMALVVRGLLNKQVGFELGISEITVKAHRGRVMEKMEARSFAELVNIAAKLGVARWHDR
jgi:FixJ family two-component response regulator